MLVAEVVVVFVARSVVPTSAAAALILVRSTSSVELLPFVEVALVTAAAAAWEELADSLSLKLPLLLFFFFRKITLGSIIIGTLVRPLFHLSLFTSHTSQGRAHRLSVNFRHTTHHSSHYH
uniref:(northern house mosquito) hypothetical protein n=1 Tax=Culex pipiens TaxID=7175 RepID=A0A8D8G606_CULPI